MGRQALLTVIVAAITTTATYLAIHFLVEPHLPVHAEDVPPLAGLTPEQARGLLEPRGLLLILDDERPDDRAPVGTLVDQRPLPGSRMRRGEDVHAAVARGAAPIKVPRLVGLTQEAAQSALTEQRLKVGGVLETSSANVPKGQVIASTPAAGVEVKPDSTIDLQVSAGPAAQAVPSVLGKSRSSAKAVLEKAGFAVGNVRYGSSDDYDSGVVISQNPSANAQAAPGARVDLTIND
jgi:serine/threonine-protein kinase